MALITSHTLNGTDGSHAGGIAVSLYLVGNATALTSSVTDDGGRLSMEIDTKNIDAAATYELVFSPEDYWNDRRVGGPDAISEIVLRFKMNDPNGQYHMPIILSPFSYSTWKSG